MGYYGMYGGGGIFSMFMQLASWVLLIAGVYFSVRWLLDTTNGRSVAAPQSSAIEIVELRYAKGEISREEFEQLRHDLVKR